MNDLVIEDYAVNLTSSQYPEGFLDEANGVYYPTAYERKLIEEGLESIRTGSYSNEEVMSEMEELCENYTQ